MNTLLHITFAPVTNYFGNGLQLETLISNGFDVKILEINSVYNFPTSVHSEKYSNLVTYVQNFTHLEEIILEHVKATTIINVQMVYEWRFRKIFRLMAKYNEYKFTIFLLGQLPFHADISIWKKVITTSPLKLPYKILTRILSKILFKINFYSNQNILFYAGETLANALQYQASYPINYFDYDGYLEDPMAGDDQYILFLDDALFQHPDDYLVGNKITTSTIESYQKSLNHYFDFIEKKMNLKLIIASHPKVNHHKKFFGGRDIIKNSTQKLVKNATLILSHCSSSVSFAVCYKKPIIFITNDTIIEFSKRYQPFHQYIKNFSIYLDRPFINIDGPLVEIKKEQYQINDERYEAFKMNYLTTKSTQNTLTKNIIIDYFKTILSEKSV